MIISFKIIKSKLSIIVLKSFVISFFAIVLLAFTFKKIRSLFPVPEIGSDKLIGFSQYYGYPFSFDTIFFFFLIFIPVLIFIVVYSLTESK